MNPDSSPPETESETGKREERKGGGLAVLLSKLGIGGAAPGAGGVVGALGGGILATKAGVAALVLAGTTVAAGIGLVGTGRMGLFSSAPSGSGEEVSPFAFPSADEEEQAAAPGGSRKTADPRSQGVSDSLQYFVNANTGKGSESEAKAEPVEPQASASAGASVPDNANAPANVGAAERPKMVPGKGFGSAGSSSGSGATLARAPAPAEGAGGAAADLKGFKPAAASAMGQGARTRIGAGHKIASGLGKSGSMGVLRATNRTVRNNLQSGNVSSPGSGLTYDGGRGSLDAIGGTSGIGPGGSGTGGAGLGKGKASSPNAPTGTKETPPPPPVGEAENKTPWQWAVYAAMAAAGIALVLLMVAGRFAAKAKELMAIDPLGAAAAVSTAKTFAGLATAAAAIATIMGIVIWTAYGQTMQGLMFTAIGGILTFQAAMAWLDETASQKANAAIESTTKEAAQKTATELGTTVTKVEGAEATFGNGATGHLVQTGKGGTEFLMKTPPTSPNPSQLGDFKVTEGISRTA